MKRKSWILITISVLGVSAACSVRRVPTPDPAATAPDAGAVYEPQREAASPPPPAVEPAPAGAAAAPPKLEVPEPVDLDPPEVSVQDLTPPASPAVEPPASGSAAGTEGYRVQVFASRDAAVAERMRQEVEAAIGARAYVMHEEPYHKVRVGDCPTREACRDLLERLRAAGYDAVWVVPDRIAR